MLSSSRVIANKFSRLLGSAHGRVSYGSVRCWSSTTTNSTPTATPNNDSSNKKSSVSSSNTTTDVLLYERSTDNYALMRSGLGFSSFHTAYWLWYNTEFIPAVNASPIEDLHIDPTLGMAGFFFALAIQAIFTIYPKRCISKLELRDNRELIIYTHSLPWIRPATQGKIVPLGEVMLDPHSKDLQEVLTECDADLRRFRGTLGMGKRWPPYILDIRDDRNVPQPDELLCALLYPELLQKQDNRPNTTTKPSKRVRNDSKLRRITRRR